MNRPRPRVIKKPNLRYRLGLLFLIGLICFQQKLFCQTNIFISGAREAALANAGVAISKDWALFHNPAGIAKIKSPVVGANYTNAYLIPELSTASSIFNLPTQQGVFGLSGAYYGSSLYNEQRYSLGYARLLNKKISAGINLDVYSVSLPEAYNTAYTIAGEIGILIETLDNLHIGAHLNNITNGNYKLYESANIPSYFSLGAAYTDELFLFTSQVNIDRDNSAYVSVGTELEFIKNLKIRMGVSSNEQQRYTFGLGYVQKSLKGDIAFARHPILGFSSQLSFSFHFGTL